MWLNVLDTEATFTAGEGRGGWSFVLCLLFYQPNFPQVGQPGHREIEEEGEEALRRLEDAVSICCNAMNVVLIGSVIERQ